MPSSILNLKFKGNKSFVAFSNLGDSDSLTKTWKVCSKVASYLEQGQRLENLSWRLWHLQNLMVETDNARSKREFKKLSKCMGDKLDKEKGRSIEELEAPGYKRNQSSEKIRQRAEEKERTREANSVRPGGTIRRMQFTFSVDKPASLAGSTPMAVDKPDLKPSQQFKDTVHRRGRPASRAAPAHDVSTATFNDKDPPLSSASPDEVFGNMHQNNAQGDGMVDVNNDSNESDGEATPSMTDSTGSLSLSSMTSLTSNSTSADSSPSLRFPSIFNNDFGPSVLFYNQPSLSASLSYGEGMTSHASSGEGFSINRPTIELPLDELLNDLNTTDTGSTGSWSPENLASSLSGGNNQDDIDMKPMDMHNMHMQNHNQHGITSVNGGDPIDIRMKNYSNGEDNLDLDSPLSQAGDGLGLGLHLPATVQMSQVWNNNNNNSNANSNNNSNGNNTSNSTSTSSQHPNRPTLSVKTSSSSTSTITTSGPNSSSRPSGPSATAMSSMNPTLLSGGNSAPGGVKAECSNCGATHTPLWRRGLNDELNCNACGLYCKLHKRPRPKSMRNTHGEGRTQTTPRLDSIDALGEPGEAFCLSAAYVNTQQWRCEAQCYNCHTMATPLWRKDDEGKTVCNACGLYFKLHGSARPISMKSDVIRKRSRHDARRGGSGGDIPSASPGASRRASPAAQTQTHSSPLLAADSSNQSEYSFPDEYDLNSASTPQQSEMSPLTADSNAQGAFSSQGTYDSNLSFSSFPGPYHPDLLFQHHPDSLSFASGEISEDTSDGFGTGNANRSNKRRRMSNDSASEPPSSTTSYSSFDQSTSQFQQSIRSALDFPFNAYMNYGNNSNGGRNSSDNAFWHPPMVPQEKSPQTLIHPPMLPPPDDSPMDFLHPPMLPQDDADQLFGSYVHRPMVLTDSPMPQVGSLYPHPPMVLSDNMYANFSQAQGQAEFYEHNSSNNNNYSSSN